MKLIASLIGAAALAALSLSAHAQAVKPDLGKGAASFGQVCAACHAADGNSVIGANPKLAGQHPEYLVKQLTEFKSGKRANAVMSGMSAALSDEDMRNIGFWLASQKPMLRMSSSLRAADMPDITALARLPDLNSVSCLTRYSGCWPANLGLAPMTELPSAAWQAAHTWPKDAAPLPRSGLTACAWADNDRAASAAAPMRDAISFISRGRWRRLAKERLAQL